ncbi:hypothetical protein [Streptomyces angustmyceticus]|uniref:hypothetical protein n=1 Tax=Streptomyces angustmyceticus TaxID=285578 RepID=UPI00344C3F80
MCDDASEPPTPPQPGLCDLCGLPLPTTQVSALVRDSSAVHPYNPDHDGMRRLTACGPGHLDELRQRYQERRYTKEELWAGKIARALRLQPDLDEEELAEVTGLNFLQIERTLTWESERFLRQQAPEDREGPESGPHDDEAR